MKILYYTDFFSDPLSSAEGFDPSLVEDLCEILTDRSMIDHADVVVFHLPNLRFESLPEKREGQVWVALSVEADAHYPLQVDREFMRWFDIRMMLAQESEIPLTYFRPHMIPSFRSKPKWKFRRAPAVYFGSNANMVDDRAQWVEELGKHLKVDRYGKGKNRRSIWFDRGRETKLQVISRYAFYLAFENASEPHYVSEKIYDAFAAGTVPVYLGAPNVKNFLPSPKCAIFANDFPNASALADYLLELRADPRRYREYLDWRHEPFSNSFLRLAEENGVPSILRLYRFLQNKLNFSPT
jgi:hypothetical protein